MNTYNKGKTDHHNLQNMINGGEHYINCVVCSVNQQNGVIPLWWFSDIHVYDRPVQKYIDKHMKFEDGLHPDDLLLMDWAEAIIKSMKINLRNCYNY